jgi:hypothetical protein
MSQVLAFDVHLNIVETSVDARGRARCSARPNGRGLDEVVLLIGVPFAGPESVAHWASRSRGDRRELGKVCSGLNKDGSTVFRDWRDGTDYVATQISGVHRGY